MEDENQSVIMLMKVRLLKDQMKMDQ